MPTARPAHCDLYRASSGPKPVEQAFRQPAAMCGGLGIDDQAAGNASGLIRFALDREAQGLGNLPVVERHREPRVRGPRQLPHDARDAADQPVEIAGAGLGVVTVELRMQRRRVALAKTLDEVEPAGEAGKGFSLRKCFDQPAGDTQIFALRGQRARGPVDDQRPVGDFERRDPVPWFNVGSSSRWASAISSKSTENERSSPQGWSSARGASRESISRIMSVSRVRLRMIRRFRTESQNSGCAAVSGRYPTVTSTFTVMPMKSFAAPLKLPANGTACAASRATAMRIRLRPPTSALVGSNSTQPAPGR